MNIKENIMTFNKNVIILLGTFKAKCHKAIVHLDNKQKKIEKIIMTGNVKIEKENSQISGEKVIFIPESDRIIVEGNVKTKIIF